MTEPVFDTSTESLYESLPEHYHRSDRTTNWTLKKLLRSVGKQLNQVDTLVDRFTYDSPEDGEENPHTTSDLIDPLRADAAWLPWLAQVFGTRIKGRPERFRGEMARGSTGYNGGTVAAMIAAAQTALIGDKFCVIYPHSTSSGPGTGGQWDMLVITERSETPTNLMPPGVSSVSNPGDWAVTGGPSEFRYRIDKFPNKEPEELFEQRALIYYIAGGNPATTMDVTLQHLHRVSSVATDPNQVFISVWIPNLPEGEGRTGTINIEYFNNSDVSLGNTATAINVTKDQMQFNSDRVVAPSGTTYYRMKVTIDDLAQTHEIAIAQAGARNEPELPWIYKTADPAQTIIERGAKPAGIILHNISFASSWDVVETALPTWNDWEARTWTQIEESSLDD